MIGMRTACGVLAGLCWAFVAVAFMALLFVVFKPRAQDSDIYPAAAFYAVSVILGVGSMVTGLRAQRRLGHPDPLLWLWLTISAAGLLFPGLLVVAILRTK